MTLEAFCATTNRHTTPGPGQYNADPYRAIGGPLSLKYSIKPNLKSTFATSDTITSKVDYMPLSNTSDRLNKLCSIKPKFSEKEPVPAVGPEFFPESEVTKCRKFSIKSRYASRELNNNPGPGSYDPRQCSGTHPPPMGARPPIVLANPGCSPGPGAYNVSGKIGEGQPKFSIRPITAPPEGNGDNPGYTYNNLNVCGSDQPKFTLSKGPLERDYSTDVPGPATYKPRPLFNRSQLGSSIHPKTKLITAQSYDVPYENVRRFPNYRPKSIHNECGRHFWDLSDKTIPGPDFVPDSSVNKTRSHSLGKREIQQPREPPQTPGPGAYNTTNPLRHSEPGFTFKGPETRDIWLPDKKEIPAPDEYYVQMQNNLPKWTIGYKTLIANANQRALTVALNRYPRFEAQQRAQTSFQ